MNSNIQNLTRMNLKQSARFNLRWIQALFARELRAAVLNRSFQIFCALGLAGGLACTIFSENAAAAAVFYLQIAHYFVSLFALLAGVSSAQTEREEWQLLLTQPLPRPAYAIGKFVTLLSILAGVLILFFLPAVVAGAGSKVAWLFLQTLLLTSVFLALGLAVGYFARDRAHGLIVSVSAWLFLLFGVDLIALFAARWSTIQDFPTLWVVCLMFNPFDAFRVDALFSLEQVPAEAASTIPLASWWIDHTAIWFGAIALVWSVTMVSLAGLRLSRWEE